MIALCHQCLYLITKSSLPTYLRLQRSQIYFLFLNKKVNNDKNKINSYVFPPGYVGLTEAPLPNRNRTVSTRLPLKKYNITTEK